MQRIPITLSATAVPVGITYADINQLLQIVARYTAAQISDDVTFVLTGAADPTAFVTLLFFNTSQGVWKYWDTATGKYTAVTEFELGDVKNTYLAGDQIQRGWVVLDGRAISAISGLSQTQANVLTTLFGIGGSLPNVTPLTSLQGLPASGAISGIPVMDILPPQDQIGNLPFGTTYDATQSEALASNAETLRTSTAALERSLVAIQAQSELMLTSLNGGTVSPRQYSKIFVGFP